MIKARIRIPAQDQRVSRSIVECVEPDNVAMRGLSIKSRALPKSTSFAISYDGRIETFISTLDDLLRCIQAANATLGMIKKNRSS